MRSFDLTGIETLVVIDPGKLTGYAVLSRKGEKLRLGAYGSFPDHSGLPDLILPDVSLVLCERVAVLGPSVSQIGVEVMGAVKFWCWYMHVPITFRGPACLRPIHRQRLIPDMVRGDEHAKDAIAHAISLCGIGQIDFGILPNGS